MGRRGYTAEFRQRVLDLVAAGRRVEDIARDLGISDQTVYSWRRQHRVDRGLESGLTTTERAELISARRRIRELETELPVHRRAAELLKGASTPKGSRQSDQRRPTNSIVIHSDQGTQFTSWAFTRRAVDSGLL